MIRAGGLVTICLACLGAVWPAIPASPGEVAAAPRDAGVVELGIAYGTEKRPWLQWAVQEFAASDAGRSIRINLIPMGSVESARAIVEGDTRIHVWSPASSLYREALLRDWGARYRGSLIVKEENLALTPMVLVMWKTRYEAFTVKAPTVSLRSIYYAMRARAGWGRIAGQPEWGLFKFGLTNPNQSNSGIMTLVLLAYEFGGKTSGLSLRDIGTADFDQYLAAFQRGVTGLSNSTGNLMQEMTAKGPGSFDALMIYESVAIDFLDQAAPEWGPLQVIYPRHNLWNENPYCILHTPWTTPAHQQAAEKFLRFLLSPPIQERAVRHGFRPGNPDVSLQGPESPWVRFADRGVRVELPEMCQVPPMEVVEKLQQAWLRGEVPR